MPQTVRIQTVGPVGISTPTCQHFSQGLQAQLLTSSRAPESAPCYGNLCLPVCWEI